jgi:hypothetical protein
MLVWIFEIHLPYMEKGLNLDLTLTTSSTQYSEFLMQVGEENK